MKTVRYILLFLIFLTLGTFVATLFAPSSHTSSHEETISSDVSEVWKILTDTSMAIQWILGLESFGPGSVKTDNVATYLVVYVDENGKKTEVKQQWEIDSISHSVTISSEIPKRLVMDQRWTIHAVGTDSVLVKSEIDLQVKGWLNRLMLTGVSTSLKDRQIEELRAIQKILTTRSSR